MSYREKNRSARAKWREMTVIIVWIQLWEDFEWILEDFLGMFFWTKGLLWLGCVSRRVHGAGGSFGGLYRVAN